MKKVLVIDGQVVHTLAMQRGMGKYSTEFLSRLMEVNKVEKIWQSIHIIVSSKLEVSHQSEALLKKLAKAAVIVKLPLERDLIYDAAKITEHNRQLVDAYISQLTPSVEVDYLVMVALQGGICSVFPSIKGVRKSVISYDVIPFMFHNIYYANSVGRRENLTKLAEFLKADTFLTISQTVANDLSVQFGVSPDRIVDIDGGPIDHGLKPQPIEVPKPFILMPTGNDARKNNLIAIQAFKKFSETNQNAYSLVITSFFDQAEIDEYKKITPNLVFTGNIKGEELKHLYQHCTMVLFPSFYEGLGLPVLEAVESFKPVACSNISVFREMSSEAFTLFDCSSVSSIAEAITNTLLKEIDKSEYRTILEKYNWQRTIELAITGITSSVKEAPTLKATIYTLSPLAGGMSAKLIQRSYAELSRLFETSYLIEGLNTDQDSTAPNLLAYLSSSNVLTSESAIEPLQMPVIYNLENNEQCARILFTALANPGIVLLHDSNLSLVWQAMLDHNLISKSRFDFEKTLQQTLPNGASMLCSLAISQKAIVVFNEADKRKLAALKQALHLDTLVTTIDYPVGSLVYANIMPEHKPVVVETDNDDHLYQITTKKISNSPNEKVEVSYNNAYEYETALSQASFIVVKGPASYQNLEAFKYGVLPVCPDNTDYEQFGSIAQEVAHYSKMVFNSNSMKIDGQSKYAAKIQNQLAKTNSYRLFAQKLSDIVSKVSEK